MSSNVLLRSAGCWLLPLLASCATDPASDQGATGGAPGMGSGGASLTGGSVASSGGAAGGVSGAGASSGGSANASSSGAPSSSGARSSGGVANTGGIPNVAGVPSDGGGAGGTAGTSMAGSSVGGSGAVSGGSGGGASGWRAATARALTEQKLSDEYTAWKAAHTQSCSDGSWVVKKDAGSVVSEGIAYGMLLSANMGDRPLFDGLWKYYSDHLDPKGLMNWATGICDPPGNNNANAATDGDLDAAMALIQAHGRWADGGYLSLAGALVDKILQHETEVCSGRAILRPGDMFGGCSDATNARINPSYFAPGYYRVFAHHFPAQASRWNALVEGSYELYPLYQARMAGLVPDWSQVDGSDWYGSGYSYDACRTPWRVMIDYAWSGDARALTFLKNVSGWVDAHGLVGAHPNNSAFVGALALASAYDGAKLDAAVGTWLSSNGDDMPYFQGTLRVLYLLAAAGKFPSTL